MCCGSHMYLMILKCKYCFKNWYEISIKVCYNLFSSVLIYCEFSRLNVEKTVVKNVMLRCFLATLVWCHQFFKCFIFHSTVAPFWSTDFCCNSDGNLRRGWLKWNGKICVSMADLWCSKHEQILWSTWLRFLLWWWCCVSHQFHCV